MGAAELGVLGGLQVGEEGLLLDLAQARLSLLDAAALNLHIELLRFDISRKFLQPEFEARPFFLELDLFGR